MADQLSYIPAQ
jgi:hypothetical protein